MTKVSLKKVMLGFFSLSLIASDAFGNMLPPVPSMGGPAMPITQTNVSVRYSQTGYRPMPMPQPAQPMPQPMPVGPHGMGGVPCPPPPCPPPPCPPRPYAVGGCARVGCVGVQAVRRVRSCMRIAGGCGARVRVSVRVGGCFGRGRRC